MDSELDLPIFPLGTVLFPGGRLPLRIFEQRYVEMTKACLRDGSGFGISLIKAGFEVGVPAVPHDLGCMARIVEWDVPSPGLFNLMTEGVVLYRILQRSRRKDGLIIGRVQLIEPPDPTPLPDRHKPMALLLKQLLQKLRTQPAPDERRFEDAAWVGYRVAELLPITPERRQSLLEITTPLELLDALSELIGQLGERPDANL